MDSLINGLIVLCRQWYSKNGTKEGLTNESKCCDGIGEDRFDKIVLGSMILQIDKLPGIRQEMLDLLLRR